LEYRFRQQIAETGIMDHGPEAGVTGHPQIDVVAVESANGGFQRETGVEAGGAGRKVKLEIIE
jgi:hypothetical protein